MWCGKETTGIKKEDGVEHIFPEAIGGIDTLPIGDVCKECNNELSKIDKALKIGSLAMMHAYQTDTRIKGKKTSDIERRQRRLKEKTHIEGISGAQIKRNPQGHWTEIRNGSFLRNTDSFSRALHKCIANVICYHEGSKFVRKNCKELLEFVKNGGDVRPWSCAVSYPYILNRALSVIPHAMKLLTIKNKNNEIVALIVCFVHTSGIWLAGSQPFLLSKQKIEMLSDALVNNTPEVKRVEKKYDTKITDLFGETSIVGIKNFIGKLNFIWIIKEIEGTKNPDDSFYLLAKCKLCNQTNPTGIIISKKTVFKGDNSNRISYEKNSWNSYSKGDLIKDGVNIEKLDSGHISKYIKTQGISIPIKNDVKKMDFKRKRFNCINCGELNIFNAGDCFL